MSWATEDWTMGLSGLVLKKVQELQVNNEKLIRERQQRQLQLDNSEAALHKQKQKYEEARAELGAVQREMVGVREQAQGEARARDRLTQELQAKVAQVCTLEGQLDSTRTLVQNLTQEVKRLEAELEKLQKESGSGESMLFSTPCWNMNSPWDQSGKISLRGEDVNKVRQQLLFGDSTKLSASAVSSPFPQQPHRTSPPLRRKASQSEARPPSSVFPWERDDTRSTPRGKAASTHVSSSFTCSEVITDTSARDDGIEEALRKEIDGLCVRVSGLAQELQLEKERCRESESRLAQAQKELNLNEQNLTRSRDELARAHTRITQEGDRAQGAEQRVKQLQEELKCQRQNADTSRCNAEQRRKEMEREHQRELLELQRERQSMEKQHQQENNKLNQEIQQARTQHNTLQSQYDKLALQKQAVERDLEVVQGKLKSTQSDLTESQKRETHTQAKLTESLKENEGLSISLEQLKKREKSLEAEVKRLAEELAEALKLIKELQAQLAAPPPQVVSHPVAGDSFSPVLSTSYSPPHQHSSQRKRTLKNEKPKISDRPGLVTYPSEREPGEGIDSEDISEFGSEDSPTVSIQEGNRCGAQRSSEAEIESSITEQDTGIEDIDTDSCMSDSISERIFKDDIRCDSENQKSSSSNQRQKRDSSSIVELKKENSSLRDELRDIKRELDQRLDDLETQRRAEAEARTKLKQLSKKHSSQAEQHRTKAQELKEKGSKLEAQLEQERKESARLREVVTTLEREAEKRKEEGEQLGEEAKEENINLKEALAQMERKEDDLEKEREKMRKELEVLQSELLQEREEREREREEEKKLRKTYEVEEIKIAKLQAELDRLQSSATVEGKNANTNMPLTYLQLGNQPNPINDGTTLENEVTSSFSDNIFFCESTNLQNTMFSKEPKTALITECRSGIIPGEHSPVEQDSTSPGNLEDHTKTTEGMNLDDTTVLILEVERMRVQRDREAERSKKLQKKLEALQNQVTSQTRQLTLAFENQSKHIEGLLKELQQRDSALQRQEEELQRCQKELASLKADKQMTETVSSLTPSAEKSADVSAELSCDIAISTTTQNSHEVATHESFHTMNIKPLQSDQQSFTNVEVGENKNNNVSASSDKTSRSHVILATAEHVTSVSPDVHGRDSVYFTENTIAEDLPETLTAAQQDNNHAIETNTQSSAESSFTETKELPEYLQKLLGHSTDNTSPLNMVINRLREAQNELSELKAKHDQLTLQLQEVSRQDVLSLKQEHEQLKLKLKLIDSEPCSSETYLKQEESNHLTNTKEESVSVTDLEEKVVIGGSFEDGGPKCGNEHEQSDHETCALAHVHSLHEQLQALQSELQLLSEKNRDQAEELQLWRLSALTPEETLDQESNSSPIVVVREEQLVLSCSPTALHSYTKQSSSMVQYGGLYQPMGFSEPCNADLQRDHQTSSDKSTEDLPSIFKAMELIADDNSAINIINDHLKPENYESAFQHVSSEMENCDHRHDLAHQIKQMRTSRDQQPGNQPCKITFSPESREDGLTENGTETKVIDPKRHTESAERKDYYVSSLMHDDLVTSTHSGKAQRNTTKQESGPSPSPVSNTSNTVQREDNVVHQQEISEVTGVTGSIDKAGAKKVNSVCTQTEECNREVVVEFGDPPQRPVVLHASTQTHGEQTTQKEEEQNDECTESPPLSPTPASQTEKLLLSGSFPIPANPAHLAERIRRNRSRMSAAYDDTEYEPYGLPEVVMKGFADIPSGPACPYVLRRGLLGTDALPISIRESPLTEADEEIDP
ncbi:centromere protein F isoform X1 [Hemibagrus wyckioides]|uniref:centromere protein F isoform X1 n=1 Tax=Hemibagrus wyckioides TaxID=337641 RepID=UPI00266D2F92|nr:centromere protein F isoform X1 [Hemibagrus wyckioides]XP_058252965.1 centromere protein F isoform X1 [Hemibagrus wyckioides]